MSRAVIAIMLFSVSFCALAQKTQNHSSNESCRIQSILNAKSQKDVQQMTFICMMEKSH